MRAVGEADEARRTLIAFVRDPAAGPVKTRLAPRLAAADAATLYAAFIADLVQHFAAAPFPVVWAVAPPDLGFARRFGVPAAACALQHGADLGARMQASFADATGDGSPCVLIGSDMPQLSLADVVAAFDRLREADLVLGPVLDGGYYLIGMCRPHDVFRGVAWSEACVLEQTLERAHALGLRVHLLPPGFDVDTPADLERLARLIARGACRPLPNTEGELRRLGLV